MALEPHQHRRARPVVSVGSALNDILITHLDCCEKLRGVLNNRFHPLVQLRMIGFQKLKARKEIRLNLQQSGKVLLVFHHVVGVQFRQKALMAMKERISGDQTVVFVSHMADHVKELCDRVIWLEKGEIVAEGDPAEILERYKSTVTRGGKKG